MLTVKSYAVTNDSYGFKFSDGSQAFYTKQSDGNLLGRMRDNSESQYKAVQAYAAANLGGISVLLSIM